MSIFKKIDQKKAILVLEDGTQFVGESFGAVGKRVGEVVFNTSMTGYQEILTDPSYYQQMVVLTVSHVGNTGINEEDVESSQIWLKGFIVKDYSHQYSNWRASMSLHEWMVSNNAVGIHKIDTRKLTQHLRKHGSMAGCIMSGDEMDYSQALTAAQNFEGIANKDLAIKVTTDKSFSWNQGSWKIDNYPTYPMIDNSQLKQGKVVVMDFGVKYNMLRLLVDRGFQVEVVPATTTAKQIMQLTPTGVLLSNGPGDPAPCDYAIATIKELIKQKLPILGICLGHQLLALALEGETMKMKFGHHGANHPVQHHQGKVAITSQNHGFSVSTLPETIEVTHISLFDRTIQGFRHKKLPIFGFQGHPEASPGPHDLLSLFDTFADSMTGR